MLEKIKCLLKHFCLENFRRNQKIILLSVQKTTTWIYITDDNEREKERERDLKMVSTY